MMLIFLLLTLYQRSWQIAEKYPMTNSAFMLTNEKDLNVLSNGWPYSSGKPIGPANTYDKACQGSLNGFLACPLSLIRSKLPQLFS